MSNGCVVIVSPDEDSTDAVRRDLFGTFHHPLVYDSFCLLIPIEGGPTVFILSRRIGNLDSHKFLIVHFNDLVSRERFGGRESD
jgi:hypothetical protein